MNIARGMVLLACVGAMGCSGGSATVDGGSSGSSGTSNSSGTTGTTGTTGVSPTVSGISPAQGPVDGGTAVRITGTGFAAGATVQVGAGTLQSATVVSSTEIDGTTPPGAAGTADVTVVNLDTRAGALRDGFTYLAPTQGPTVGFCNLQFPTATEGTAGAPLDLYGRVYVAGVTDAAGQGAGVHMQAGLSGSDGGIAWQDASYNVDAPSAPGAQDLNNDEYVLHTTYPAAGTYASAFRAQVNGGDYTYCELDGSHASYDPSQAGAVTADAPAVAQVDFCNLQYPADAGVTPGETLSLYGRIYAAGITDLAGQGAGITMQGGLGYGDGGWSWFASAYNGDVASSPGASDLNNDEYRWDLLGPAPGTYATAFRAKLGDGGFRYCELDGAHDSLDLTQLGRLTSSVAPPPAVSFCNVQFPTAQAAQPGDPVTVYGRVYQPGVTDQAGQGPGVFMQLGITGGDGGFVWQDATFNVDAPSAPGAPDLNNDEYQATFNAPSVGNYALTYRAALDGGPWTFCEVDGVHAGYAPLSAAPLTVGATVSFCNLQFPAQTTLDAGSSGDFYGRVYQPGVTDEVGQGVGITMQLGYGFGDGGFTWQDAGYNVDAASAPGAPDLNNDEYRATLTVPGAGTYLTLFRAQLYGGPWLYCEPDGSHLGIDASQAGTLTVP